MDDIDVTQSTSRPTPMTLLMPIRPGRSWLVRLRLRLGLGPGPPTWYELWRLRRLGFLHTGRWQIVDRFPFCGPPQRPERDRRRYLLFASDYDGPPDTYLDAFSDVLAWRLNTLWHWCLGYPGAAPSGPFKRYVHHWEISADHYYSAPPNAAAKTIDQALALERAWRQFHRRWGRNASPAEFAKAFRRFLRDHQARL